MIKTFVPVLFLAAATLGLAQEPAPAASGAGVRNPRIAVINMETISSESIMGKGYAAQLELLQSEINSEGTKKQSELQKLDAAIKTLQDELEKQASVLSPEAAEKKRQDIVRRGRERQAFLHQLLRAEVNHAAHRQQGARTPGSVPGDVEVRPRRTQPDLLHRNAEHAGDELRVRGLVPLAVVVRRRVHGQAAFFVPAQLDLVLRREAGARRFDVRRHASTQQAPAPGRFCFSGGKPVPVGRLERLVEHAAEIA